MVVKENFNIFGTHEKFMSIWDAWPRRTKLRWSLYNKIGFTYLFTGCMPFVAFVFFRADTLVKYSQSFMEISELTLLISKFFVVINYRIELRAILDDLNVFFKRVDSLDGCKGIGQKMIATNGRFAKLFFYVFFIVVFTYNNIPVAYNLFNMWRTGITGDLRLRPQVYLGQYVAENIVTHSIAMIFFCSMGIYLAGLAMGDALFVTLLLDVSVTFECISRRLVSLKAETGLSHRAMEKKLKDIIKDHVACLRISDKLRKFLQPVLLLQFVASLTNTSFQLIQYALKLNQLKEVSMIFLFTMQSQIPMIGYCYFANQITTKSERIAYDVYDQEWFDQSTRFKKTVIRMMEKAQQPEHMTAGKLFEVSLSTYGKFMKTAYTFFMFLLSFDLSEN